MPAIELSAGTIDYLDTGGDGPAVVPVHGLVMDGTVWRDVVADLRADHRCIVPTLPLGAHRTPMAPGADLSLAGQADLLAEFLDRMDLDDVTLVVNDWGGPLVTAARHPELVDRLVVTPCEAFDNFPPGLPGRFAALAGRLPGGVLLAVQSLRLGFARHQPMTFGWMTVEPPPADLVAGWIEGPRRQRAVRRDLEAYIRKSDGRELESIVDDLAALDIPALVAWTSDGRVMPAEHGPRLAELLPHGHYVEIADARVLVQLDRPGAVATLIRDFIHEHPLEPATSGPRRHRRGGTASS
jgi:pimeloyl-ACP methyl ester carboxylesterase